MISYEHTNTDIPPSGKKIKKDGKAPVYLRITINGTRSEVSTKVAISPTKWEYKKELIRGKEQNEVSN
ncbi:Arm DNA-binding domain-containing protein [Algoriphagus faecimaris]|nr:Arm DNA-binding domain-containing protein [Algoriphagus faecimaris]